MVSISWPGSVESTHKRQAPQNGQGVNGRADLRLVADEEDSIDAEVRALGRERRGGWGINESCGGR